MSNAASFRTHQKRAGARVYAKDPETGEYRWYEKGTEPVNRQNDSHNLRSAAVGINPDQIPEALAEYPHHKFCPVTGDMLFKDRQEKLEHLAEIGYHDQDEVKGGPSR